MKPLQVAELGNPILRVKSKPVENIADKKIQVIIDRLLNFVIEVNGVGISSVQISLPFRLFIIASHPNPRYPHAPYMVPTPVINPVILSSSKTAEKGWEGCLSIPGLRGYVARHTSSTVEFYNRDGLRIRTKYSGFIARIFQHEYDHLNGILFVDRVNSNKDLITDKEYFKILEKQKS